MENGKKKEMGEGRRKKGERGVKLELTVGSEVRGLGWLCWLGWSDQSIDYWDFNIVRNTY